MKISYSWLKEHLPLEISAEDLAGHLPQLGFEVAEFTRKGPAFSNVIVAEIIAVAKHPNADRLSLCEVTDGTSKYSVVCGAKNVAVGQKVALAKVGAKLPGGEIKPAKIRGVESQGMICASAELGLPADAEAGIRVLDARMALGTDFAQTLGGSDSILDVEITPNRPDCLSHLGLARELSAYFRFPVKTRVGAEAPKASSECWPVSVEDAMACPRYTGRLLTGVRVGPSPAWLASKLEAVGMRPINNVVDVTNFVLMDMGQPLHAFDADLLAEKRVTVRYARRGEKIKTLDGRTCELNERCLVIADARNPIAIAGVMGGLDSAVTEKTANVFLESAHFRPATVRAASQYLRLRSDSSYRFERGTDVEAVAAASERAAALILELGGPDARASKLVDAYPEPRRASPIEVSTDRINQILGTEFPQADVEAALAAIGSIAPAKDKALTFTPPSYRGDLTHVWDLAEEVARLSGYDQIPSRTPVMALKPAHDLPSHAVAERCRTRLATLGLMEAYNYDFVSDKLLAQAGVRENQDLTFARLINPLNEDWTILRPTLLPGLLQNAALNLNRGASSVRLFEIGRVYRKDGSGLVEKARLSGLILGARAAAHWQAPSQPSDFYDAKGVLAELTAGIPGLKWAEGAASALFHPKASLQLESPKGTVATVGLIHPQASRAWDLGREGAAIFDVDLDLLASLGPTKLAFKPYGVFPSSRRDLSFFVDRPLPYAEIESAVNGCRIKELTALEVLDVFNGKGVPEGKKSVTIRLSFALEDRTLKDAEVNAAVEKVLAALKGRFGAVLRA